MTRPVQPEADSLAATDTSHSSPAPAPASPSSAAPQAQLLKCLSLLDPHAPDEQKFVALLLLPRLLDPATDPVGLTLCFDRMDWGFVHRLLIAEDSTPDMPPEALHSIAVDILAGFSLNDDLVQRPELLEQVPYLIPLLANHTTNSEVLASILETLHRIAITPAGATMLVTYAQPIGAVAIAHAQDDTAAPLALHLLAVLFTYSQANNVNSTSQLIAVVAKIFATIETKYKFEAASLLVEMTMGLEAPAETTVAAAPLPLWALDVRIGVMNILRSKISTDHRDLAFTLTASMLRVHTPAWLSLKQTFLGHSPLTPAQFTTLLTHLAGGEIRLLLDDASPTSNTTDIHTRGETRLVVCADIVEGVMRALMEIGDDAEDAGLPEAAGGEMVQGVRKSLHETLDAVMAYIVDVWAHYQHTPSARLLTAITTTTALRLLATYLAEADCTAAQTVPLVPFLILALPTHPFLVPTLESLTADAPVRTAFVSHNGLAALVNSWSSQASSSSSMIIRSVVSTLLNIVTTTPSAELKSHAETFRKAVHLALTTTADHSTSAAATTPASSPPPVLLRAHFSAFVALAARDVFRTDNITETDDLQRIVALAGGFLRDGVEDGFRSKEWQSEAVRELYLLTASAVAGCAAAAGQSAGSWAEGLQKMFAGLSKSKLEQLEPEMRESLMRIASALNAKR
ncbi:hypothetical protein HDU86_002757 [Geranomyces michiganensis]|nr:hypothetical protein HDU86_002757 [Geranomyces michiganensis]